MAHRDALRCDLRSRVFNNPAACKWRRLKQSSGGVAAAPYGFSCISQESPPVSFERHPARRNLNDSQSSPSPESLPCTLFNRNLGQDRCCRVRPERRNSKLPRSHVPSTEIPREFTSAFRINPARKWKLHNQQQIYPTLKSGSTPLEDRGGKYLGFLGADCVDTHFMFDPKI